MVSRQGMKVGGSGADQDSLLGRQTVAETGGQWAPREGA